MTVVESPISRHQTEPTLTEIPPLPFATTDIQTDWQGLLVFHTQAAADRRRPAASRRFHAGQASELRSRLAVAPLAAWDWAEFCSSWSGFASPFNLRRK